MSSSIDCWTTSEWREIVPEQSLDDAVEEWLESLEEGETIPSVLLVFGYDEDPDPDESYDDGPALFQCVTAFVPMRQWIERTGWKP
jgi:hypothetical protein